MIDLTSGNLQFGVHGGADSGGGVAGAVEGFLGFVDSLLALSPAQMFAHLMPGISAMDNLHPLFVHFPIALLSLFFLLDFVGSLSGKAEWRSAAGWFLYCGTIFAGLPVVMGFVAAASVPHGGDVHEIMEHHQHLGVSVFLLAASLAIWRWLAKGILIGAANTLYLILAAILGGVLVFTADLGGLMVFKYGVAVEPMAEINREAAERHQHGGERTDSDDDHHGDIGGELGASSHQHDHNH